MPKSSLLIVHEDVSELRSLIRKESNPKNVLRLQSLVHIKEETFVTRVLLANHLGYSVRSMELWLKEFVDTMTKETIISITSNHNYLEAWNANF